MSLLRKTVFGASYPKDPDAKAFINATQITDYDIIKAVDKFCIELKDIGVWDKMPFVYPMVSDGLNQTRAFQHKFNLKDPRDLDAAFRISENILDNHNEYGMKGHLNSINFNPFTLGYSLTNFHLSFYTSDNYLDPNTANAYVIGNNTGSAITNYLMVNRSGFGIGSNIGNDATIASFGTTAVKGLVTGVRNSTSSNKVFLNGELKKTNTLAITNTSPFNGDILLFVIQTQRCQYASGGVALTDAEVLAHAIAVENLQITIGRPLTP